jgi:hypothetical protein
MVETTVTVSPFGTMTLLLRATVSVRGIIFAMKSGSQMQLIAVASIHVWMSNDQNITNERFAITVPARNQRPFFVKL